MHKWFTACFIFCLLPFAFCLPASAQAGNWAEGRVTNSSGARNYKLWIPSKYTGKQIAPLVMMLHGCTQTPDEFAAGTGMNVVAEANNFLVVYPEQPQAANLYKCWNWFETAHQTRGAGEPSLLAEIVNRVRSAYKVDAQRVFVAGVSAGGAMAVIMGATYPDLFAGIGVHSGLAYQAGTNLSEGLAAQSRGGTDLNQMGQLAFQAMGSAKRRMRVIVFQGSEDGAVAPVNADQIITQWAQTNDHVDDGRDNNSVDDTADDVEHGVVPDGYRYTRYIYRDGARRPLMEKWLVSGMKHAWAGGKGAPYTDPKGPPASQEMWRFFQQGQKIHN